MSLVIGITGGIGCGKSAATSRFEELGIAIVDADRAARVVMAPGGAALAAVARRYGGALLLADGSLDRAALRERVFAEPAERQWLERLTHPLIGEEVAAQLAAASSPYAIFSSALLFETAQRDWCDQVVLVDAPEALQLARAMARDDNDEAQVRRIMAAQMPRGERRARADHIIDNTGGLEELRRAVDCLHRRFLREAAA